MNARSLDIMHAVNGGADPKDMKLRVVDYARVSTASAEQRNSYLNQIDTYSTMIRDNPNWEYIGTYSDEAITGTKAALRGGFQKMLEDAEAGKYDMIICKDVARFARNLKECLVYKDMLKSYGVMIWFVNNRINTFRSSDEMMLNFMAMGAEMEAKSARERTKIVFEQGIEKGRVYGNSKILGYKKDHCKLVIDEQEAEVVRTIFELYVHQRMGMRRIAQRLAELGLTKSDGSQIPTRTIKYVLENPKYKGFYCGRKTVKLDVGEKYTRRDLPEDEWKMYKDPTIPSIVSEALWDEAAKIRAEKNAKYRQEVSAPCNQGIYRYSGKIESGVRPGMHYQRVKYCTKQGEREGWQCRTSKDARDNGNVGPTLYSDELDNIIHTILDEMLGGYDRMVDDLLARYQSVSQTADTQKRISALKKEMSDIEKKKSRVFSLYEDEQISKAALAARINEHEQRTVTIQKEISRLEHSANASRSMLQSMEALREIIAETARELQPSKELIDRLFSKIVVLPGSTKGIIQLEFHFRVLGLKRQYTLTRH